MPDCGIREDWVDVLKEMTRQEMLWDVVVSGASLRDWEIALGELRRLGRRRCVHRSGFAVAGRRQRSLV